MRHFIIRLVTALGIYLLIPSSMVADPVSSQLFVGFDREICFETVRLEPGQKVMLSESEVSPQFVSGEGHTVYGAVLEGWLAKVWKNNGGIIAYLLNDRTDTIATDINSQFRVSGSHYDLAGAASIEGQAGPTGAWLCLCQSSGYDVRHPTSQNPNDLTVRDYWKRQSDCSDAIGKAFE